MKKYTVLWSKNGARWGFDSDTTSKATAINRAKAIEKIGGFAEVWVSEEKGGIQTQYKIR